jgi:hypothetical protein
MSVITYSGLFGEPNQLVTFNNIDNSWYYPDSNVIDVVGRLYAPGIYGKQLSAFEIASSGKIAITINDVHTLDILRADTLRSNSSNTFSNYTTVIKAIENESLLFSLSNPDDTSIFLDAVTSNIIVKSKTDIYLSASNVHFSTSNDTTFTSQSNLIFIASNDIYLTSQCNIIMTAANGAVRFELDPPDANIYFIASNNIDFTSADTGIGLYAMHSNVVITLNSNMDLNMYAKSNFYLYANDSNVSIVATSNNLSINALSNFYLYANDSNVSVIAESNNLNLSACNINMNTTNFSLKKYISASNMLVKYKFNINDANDLEIIKIVYVDNSMVSANPVTRYTTRSHVTLPLPVDIM